MTDECIVFSDPRSTTKVQIATRDGSQKSTWLGQMKYTNLKVFNGQNRNSTATFTIFGYNTSDAIDQWMLPGIAVFVVRLGHLRFSGVISKVDGEYAGYDLSQTYRITCESDANWLLNRTTCTKNGVAHKQVTAKTILMDILNPDIMWYDNSAARAAVLFDDTQRLDYTVSDKPALVQVQELATLAGMKYRVRTLASRATITAGAVGVTHMTKTGGDSWITVTSSTIGKGSHNKWIMLRISWSAGYSHTSVCAVLDAEADHSIGPTSTDAINYSAFSLADTVLLIQHPVLEFQPTFAVYTTKTLYVNPTSTGGVLTQSPCWNYSPLAEKNDVITKVTADGLDGAGNPISIALAAAFPYYDRAFIFQQGAVTRYITQNYDNQNLIDTSLYPNKIQIYYDDIFGWAVGSTGHITQSTGGLYQEQFEVATITYTGEVIGGRNTVWLNLTAPLTYDYVAGDAVCPGGEGYAYFYVNDTSNFTVDGYYWVGRELIKCMSIALDAAPGIIRAMRAIGFISSQGYTTRTYAGPHKKYIFISEGMPPDASPTLTQKCFDRDDYYDGTSYDSPIKIYGINTKHITVNKAVDAGTLELVCYNVLRNSCQPKYKGNLSCFIDALVDPLTPFNALKPGDQFVVDYFGTVQPGTAVYYEIMSMDMDFDSGTCVLQFDEYDISLMMALANMGLSINIT